MEIKHVNNRNNGALFFKIISLSVHFLSVTLFALKLMSILYNLSYEIMCLTVFAIYALYSLNFIYNVYKKKQFNSTVQLFSGIIWIIFTVSY